jgi:hypothetical protein
MDFVLAITDDWQGLYFSGNLVTQNHRLSAAEILRAMDGYKVNGGRMITQIKEVDFEWITQQTSLPERLEDVKFAK